MDHEKFQQNQSNRVDGRQRRQRRSEGVGTGDEDSFDELYNRVRTENGTVLFNHLIFIFLALIVNCETITLSLIEKVL